MKKILTILLLFASLTAGAAKYYISTAGTDGAGVNGSIGTPWRTLSYACTRATTSGDTIVVGVGTFTETAQSVLAAGVSIFGAGVTSIITTGAALNPMIAGTSGADGTNGNQSISYVYLDGNLTALTCVSFTGRSNVKVHDVTIIDFVSGGVLLRGAVSGTNPSVFATGNEIHNCTITNSATRGGGGSFSGLISISGQEGLLIYDNVLDQTDRAEGDNGNIVNAVGGGSQANSGFNNGVKYYRNTSYKNATEGAEWNFHIESWDATGWEISDSQFLGGGVGVDIGGYVNSKGAYNYAFYIHDCIFEQDAMQPINADGYQTIGVDVESATSDVIIERCSFRNLQWGVYHSLTLARAQSNISVRYCIFENCGVTDNQWGGAAMLAAEGTTPSYNYITYDNNTMTAGRASAIGAAFYIALTAGTATNIHFRNNITKDFWHGPIWVYSGAGQTGTFYHYNNLHDNDGNAIYYSAGETITTLIASNNIVGSDPLFISSTDFRLQIGSPAINTGLDLGYTSDYQNNPMVGIPDIGAYEWGVTKQVNHLGHSVYHIGKRVIQYQ